MTRFISLSSGSNGNCYYLGNEDCALLVDAGLSGRAVKKRLEENKLPIEAIRMILVTHDHVDHVKCLGSIAERLKVPIYATRRVAAVLQRSYTIGSHINGFVRTIEPGEEKENFGVAFRCFEVPHDATQTVGYCIDFFGDKFLFATDLGRTTDDAVKYARQCGHIIIESNYDVDMLISGNYPPLLKSRIMSGNGHLSNDQTAGFLKQVWHEGLKHVWLCHLSENNNTPLKAYDSAFSALTEAGAKVGDDVDLSCLPRYEASEIFVME
jgi:phosphoribosyl 1,2-cyclic phosphodiesterase